MPFSTSAFPSVVSDDRAGLSMRVTYKLLWLTGVVFLSSRRRHTRCSRDWSSDVCSSDLTRTGWNGQTWGANQRISVEEALRINTINGAYNSHEEAIKGSITSGKLADFVVLADDPHTVDQDKIKDIEIVRTVVGGSTVYTA